MFCIMSASNTGGPMDAKSVLIIDDDQDIREACTELLLGAGYDVDSARDGYDALKKIEAVTYNLIIVDINMPLVDGIDFYLRAIRKSPEMKKRFLFMTGDIYGEQEALDMFVKTENTVLKKPFTKDIFLKAVSDTLQRNG